MSDNACFKCPNCNKMTFGVKSARHPAPVFCPICKKNGVNSVMLESNTENPVNMGDGLFKKNDKDSLNEEHKLLNESN